MALGSSPWQREHFRLTTVSLNSIEVKSAQAKQNFKTGVLLQAFWLTLSTLTFVVAHSWVHNSLILNFGAQNDTHCNSFEAEVFFFLYVHLVKDLGQHVPYKCMFIDSGAFSKFESQILKATKHCGRKQPHHDTELYSHRRWCDSSSSKLV